MTALTLPCTLFTTQRKINDTTAVDMRYGDLTASRLQQQYYLTDVSEKVDPYTLTALTPFDLPQSRFYTMHDLAERKRYSKQECAEVMFNEMRSLSWPFSVYGPYQQLINKMIDHMQYANGAPFSDIMLDIALREQLMEDNSKQSSLKAIKETLDRRIDYDGGFLPETARSWLTAAIQESILPQFARSEDNFNGLGISIHDIYAMEIRLLELTVKHGTWRAKIRYQAQDHFGLDDNDIMQKKFNQFRFFRLWFVLQRYQQLGYKPFFTNMDITVEVAGEVK